MNERSVGIFSRFALSAVCLGFVCGIVCAQNGTVPSVQRPTAMPNAQTQGRAALDNCEKCDQTPDLTKSFGKMEVTKEKAEAALNQFVKAYQELDSLVEEHDQISDEIVSASPERQKELSPRMAFLTKRVHDLYHETQDLIEAAWIADPQNDEVVAYMLFLLASAIDEDQYEVGMDLVREMMTKKIHEREPIMYEMAGINLFMTNRFDAARLCFNEALRNEELTEAGGIYTELIPYYTAAWKVESELRKRDAAKNDLPRVLLQTSKGNVVIELFEDQAPNTVANFIYLVEKGYYDGNDFHTVISGFLAQTGSRSADGSGNPGYAIPDEFARADARKHFRGSLSMANNGTPNSAGSQFFITLVPAPHLDGKYTVFGRVIQGMEIISALERYDVASGTNETESGWNEADKIVKAKVVRKRDHQYVPKVLKLDPTQNPSTTGSNQ
ncbi:MAG: peptidylprolyl isomerase [Planctomycetia bacterium]|nr:peptidylprolyl isomerase [Planctomycetia bacterium]